jgi:N utilization substance protein B
MSLNDNDGFPLSKVKVVNGSRRLAREKILQILTAHEVSDTAWQTIFSHVFFRKFNFDDKENLVDHKILTEDEVIELESDTPIEWKEEEILFARGLIAKVIENKDKTDKMIIEFAANWEIERIAKIDRLLMHLAINEMLYAPEVPTKVSINEAIDIAKKYSTYKSGTFINGILDSIKHMLINKGLIVKSGRGLIEK